MDRGLSPRGVFVFCFDGTCVLVGSTTAHIYHLLCRIDFTYFCCFWRLYTVCPATETLHHVRQTTMGCKERHWQGKGEMPMERHEVARNSYTVARTLSCEKGTYRSVLSGSISCVQDPRRPTAPVERPDVWLLSRTGLPIVSLTSAQE